MTTSESTMSATYGTSSLTSTMTTLFTSENSSTTMESFNTSSTTPSTNPFDDMPLDSNFAWLLCALTCVFLWMIYGSCFHSRVIGYIIGSLINQYLKRSGLGELRIGSLKVGVVSGRLAFKNVRYINEDYCIVVYDGYIWFSYWLSYRKKQLSDYKQDPHRLFLHLYGLEIYVYNRTEVVAQLQKFSKAYEGTLYEKWCHEPMPTKEDSSRHSPKLYDAPKKSNMEKIQGAFGLRSLFSVLDLKLSVFRMVLGNYRAPYCLVVGGSSATLTMTYEAATCQLDPFSTVITGSLKNIESAFQLNPDYPGEVPLCPYDTSSNGKGRLKFFSTEAVQLNRYVVDTPTDVIALLINDGPSADEQLMKWSAELTFSGRTDIIYGGWIDARRSEIHQAVFPPTRSELPVTNTFSQRSYGGFELKLSTKSSVYLTLYLLDTAKQVQKFILSCDAGTEFSLFFPYVLRESGFTTAISIKATHLRGITSLAAKNLVEADEMNLRISLQYSRVHHGPQYWNLQFSWTNVSAFFLYEHKKMIAEVILDWTREAERPDLLHFVPFHVNLDFAFNGFELITYAGQHNWIDCTKNGLENTYVVFGGPQLKLGLVLNFQDFLPQSNEVPFSLSSSSLDVKMYFPDSHAQHSTIASLYLQANLESFAGKRLSGRAEPAKAFRDIMLPNALWVHTWSADNFRLNLRYCYHNDHQNFDQLPQLESGGGTAEVLEADVMELEMSLASSQLILSGSLAKAFYALKENYLGESQEPMSMESNVTAKLEELLKKSLSIFESSSLAGAKKERSLEVNVVGQFMDTTCHLLKPCDAGDPPCPRAFAKNIVLEVLKQWEETTLQLLINPIVVEIPDNHTTESYRDPLQNGQVLVSFFQLRGHAMFSDADIVPGGETLEYAWLMDFQLGDVVCRASVPQIYSVIAGLEGLISTADDTEDDFIRPEVLETCYHGVAQAICTSSTPTILCPRIEDIKYRMTRLSVDSLHVYILETDSCAYLQIHPVWMSACNLRSPDHNGGLSLIIPHVTLKQFVWSHVTPLADQDVWIEATSFKLGSFQLDHLAQIDEYTNTELQMPFLKRHDSFSHRLKFLWDDVASTRPTKCACFGGSEFFGRPFTTATWNGLADLLDLALVSNDAGLEVGQRIFEAGDNADQMNIVSLDDLMAKFAKNDTERTSSNSTWNRKDSMGMSPIVGANISDTSASQQKSKNAWIPDRRRPSVGSLESFYSAAENQEEDFRTDMESPTLPDLLKDLDRQSVSAISQTTISTISMAPDRAPPTITVSNFPVNLHAQLGKKTQESPLLMAGYVPQVHLWQRGIINVTIVGTEQDEDNLSKFSFYLPNFQKVKGGLDLVDAFVARVAPSSRQKSQLFPRHYRNQSSVSSTVKFVDFGSTKEAFSSIGSALLDVRLAGCTDLMLTPISCDALLPMIQSLNGFVTKLRPSLFLSACYRQCVRTARVKHTFNDDRIMLAKISEHLAFDPEAPTEKQKVSESKKTKSPLPRDSDFRFSSNNSGVESGSTVRAAAGLKATMAPSPTAGHFLFGDQPWIEKRTVNDQYSISIDQVNIVTLQCGIVEEVVGTKDLSSPRDLICVSVLTGSLRSLSGVFARKGTSTNLVKIYTDRRISRPYAKPDGKGPPVVQLSPLSGIFDLPDIVGAESKTDTVTDSLLHVSVQAGHAQLRRLRHSEIWRKARITFIPENKSSTWFEYNPKQSPVDEYSPYRKLFTDVTGTDQTGFIVLEMGVDNVKVEGGGRIESEEHIDNTALGPLLVPTNFPPDLEEPISRSTPDGPPFEVETGSGHSGSSSKTFIAHPSEEDLRVDGLSPDVGFKISATIGAVWLNCPTPSKKTGLDREQSMNSEAQLRSFTRLDWHFLSTANPVVDAWMHPLDRANVALKSLSAVQHRNDVTLASYFLIIAVNDHILPKASKTKQSRHTLKGRILQEDCCSRLARIVQKHGLALTSTDIQHVFDKELMPPVEILEKSIFVLFKQLRYTPFARVLLEPQFLLQKFKTLFRQTRDPGTLDSSVIGLADEVDGLDGEDTFADQQEVRKHPESPYPPLGQDLNAWLEEETAKVTTSRSQVKVTLPKIDLNEMHDDSDSPYEDGDLLSGPGKQASIENIFGPLLSQLGLQKKSNVSFLKKIIGFHVGLNGKLDSIQICLVESTDLNRPDIPLVKETLGARITALRCNNVSLTMEILLDIPTRCVDVFIPDYHDRFVLTSKVNRISVITYKFDMAELAQTVSMPLLRLLAQIGTVITNMQRVRADLKKNWPDKKGHRKTDSTSTSGSGTSRSDSPGQPRMRGADTYMDFVLPESSKHWKDLMNLMALYTKPTENRVIDETKRTRRVSSMTEKRVHGMRIPSMSFRKGKKPSSDNNSSSGAQSDEAPELRRTSKEQEVLSDGGDGESEHEPDLDETPTSSSSRAHIDSVVQRHLKKTSKYGTGLSISGIGAIRNMTFEASLRGLNFQAALSSLSFNHNFTVRKSRSGQLDESFYQVRTGQLSVQLVQKMGLKGQLYLGVGLGSSQAAFSSLLRNLKSFGQRSLNVRLGELHFSVPHHPITLHSMVVRGAEDLKDAIDDLKLTAGVRPDEASEKREEERPTVDSKTSMHSKTSGDRHPKSGAHYPIKTTFMLKKLIITAAPLPSLEGSYEISKLLAYGTIGNIALMHFDFGPQDLKFKSTNEDIESTANFQLPPVYVKTSYEPIPPVKVVQEDNSVVEFKDVRALYVTARAGSPEYTFGTDALKYTVLFQKVFMKEIEEVLDTLSQPISQAPLKTPKPTTKRKLALPFFHQINLQQDGIRVTGTTPTSSAVRLEIDKTAVYVSNVPKGSACVTLRELEDSVVSVQLDVGINLGQLVQGEQQMYAEAQPDFQPYAHFRTRMTFSNYGDGPLQALLQGYDERIRRKRVVAHLSQPRIYFQPRAVDMAVIFYINYKNAYEYWYVQRHGTVRPSSRESRTKKTPPSHLQQVVAQRAIQTIQESIYVIELFISQMYVCMPLPTGGTKNTTGNDRDTVDMAVLVSLDRTKIRAVLAQSIIISGTFDLFRLCFTEDRGPHYDYTGRQEDFTNYCFVPKGYVEVTSRTAKKEATESGLPKWDLYFKWDMNGIETHMDPSIGKIISNLSDAMTLFTGEEGDSEANDEVFRPKHGRNRARLMEEQMQIHAKIFSELQSEGASQQDIQTEAEKLKRIEQGIVHEIRRDFVSRIRQKSISSRGSMSEYRSHRRTSSTPQSDLSPTTPEADAAHGRTFSVDLAKARSNLQTPLSLPSNLSTTKKARVESLKEEPISPRSGSAPEAEQSFDFDFTVLINIESGHCVFYSGVEKDRKKGTQSKETSADVSSESVSPARRGSDFTRRTNLIPCCTLYIPGVNLEIQYESDGSAARTGAKISSPEKASASKSPGSTRFNLRPMNGSPSLVPGDGKRPKKKGNLFATCSLESLPAETVLTPQLLDFIEQALEPIPIVNQTLLKDTQPLKEESDSDNALTEAWDAEAALESFPVDIFVLFMMNSTKIRCSCLPVSKVEGVLTLPSLSMMVSTRKLNQSSGETDRMRVRQENIGSGRPVLDMLEEMLHHLGPDHNLPDLPEKYEEYAGMGLYGNLSGFSLVIFHPYGTVSENAYYDSTADRNVRAGTASHGAPDKRELVRLELDRLHIEIVRSKSLVEDVTLRGSNKEGPHIANSIEFSAVVSVGKTTFWYDLRRLGEILAFPKAWYRRSIARRFFLGEEVAETVSMASTGSVDTTGSSGRHEDALGDIDSSANPSVKPKEKNVVNNERKDETVLPWRTLVLVGLKVSALDFNVNMGNVMGNTVLLVEDINCVGRFSAASDGHSDVFACIVATSVDLNSRGGVVGGGSQWKRAQIYGHVRNEVGTPPMHAFGCMMHAAESRLEYMGAVSVLARMSKLNVRIRDIWALQAHGYRGGPKLTATVNCTWDQMQAIICSASTSHVVKSIIRVTEFFEEQLKSSRQFISTFSSTGSGSVPTRRRSSLLRTRENSSTLEARYHRHWQKSLEFLSGYRLTSVVMAPFPQRGGVLKGDLNMNGQNISLACFYGNSFRGKSWARFSIKEPRLVISCEGQQKGEDLVNVIQNMAFHLGNGNDEGALHAASVARVTCNNPPPLLNMSDWFEFMFMNSALDEVGRFPSGHTQKINTFQDIRLNMTIETILALPVVVISLRSEQVQAEVSADEIAAPIVSCNFNCDFGAPISIDMGDSQAFYFLHQLINSYLANTDAESIASKREVPNPTEVLKEDARFFQVNEWCLQPSFKLLQRIGRDIETIGVERVMNRLGFSQAQTTIPKWIQRGLVDPVDKGFAVLALVLLRSSKHDRIPA